MHCLCEEKKDWQKQSKHVTDELLAIDIWYQPLVNTALGIKIQLQTQYLSCD